MKNKSVIGSSTAKGGFANEHEVVKKFNNWQNDFDAKKWLKTMGYKITQLKSVCAIQIPTSIKISDLETYNLKKTEDYNTLTKYKKADVQIKLIIKIGNITKIENISLKKTNVNSNYNQVDKRPVDTYKKMWKFDDEIALWLKLFTGEKLLKDYKKLLNPKSCKEPNKRLYINEFPLEIQNKIISFFDENRILIVSDILKGRGGLSANWLMVTKKENNITSWKIIDINTAMNHFGSGPISITSHGSLSIGNIIMQRKGGTPDPTSLQFKIHPNEIFNLK